MIGSQGMDIITGGGPGLIDAASRGHHAGSKGKDVHSIGLTIKLSHEQFDGYHLDIKKDFTRFSGRLDKFMELSNVVVVAPGGIGTLLELLYTWQLEQVKHICDIPIILLGEDWQGLLDWIKKAMLRKGLVSKDDFKSLFVVKSCTEAMKIIDSVHNDFKDGKEICTNFEKYNERD
jgi:predicted Rossmann-fold nucleotide-binding protein